MASPAAVEVFLDGGIAHRERPNQSLLLVRTGVAMNAMPIRLRQFFCFPLRSAGQSLAPLPKHPHYAVGGIGGDGFARVEEVTA